MILNSGQDEERSNHILESTLHETRQNERVLT